MKQLFATFAFSLFFFVNAGLSAQTKQLSEDEIWNQKIQITDPVFSVTRWDNNNVYLSSVDMRDGNRKNISVNLKTGKTSEIENSSSRAEQKNEFREIIKTIENAVNPTVSPDSLYIAFTRENDLYTFRIADKKETRLTFDGSDVILNGYASWVYMEEILGRRGNYRAFWWSPDSKHIAFFRADDSEVPLFTITDSPTQNGYVETLRYPKPGNPIPQVKTGIVKADGGDIVWASIDEKGNNYFGLPYWRPDGKALWLQWLNRGQDNYKIFEIDMISGASRELYNETQSTWISIDYEPRIRFLESGKGFILTSDKSGWNHLYLHDMNGKLIAPITSGDYTVSNVLGIDEKANTLYFTSSKDNFGHEDFYKINLNGKNLQRLSFGDYTHRISLSNDYKYFVTTYSNVKTPRIVELYTTKGKRIATIQNTKNENFDLYEKPQTDYVVLKSDDGLFNLPMRVTYPINMEKDKTYPVKIYVYGGPGNAVVRSDWADNFSGDNYKFAQDGLIQVVMDHRGSGQNGKIGQNQMHRNLGYWEIKDYSQCVEWLVANKQANAEKILITGFSYGGYITIYALTYGADVFTHGIAGGSVTDWSLYDATYTERFMDTPEENPEGYKSSSVLTHADKLQGKLMLTHGLLDENVHAQNTFQLISLMQELNKTFELMIYPESRHGYRGKKNEHSRKIDREFIYRMMNEE